MTNKEYHIELLQEEWDSLIAGKEICVFENEEESFKIFIIKPAEEKKIYDKQIFLKEIEESIGTDRYDGEYNQEFWDYEELECSVVDNTMSLKIGDIITKDYIEFVVEYSNDRLQFDKKDLVLDYDKEEYLYFKLTKEENYELINREEEADGVMIEI